MINILDIVPEIKHLDSTYINAMQLKLNDYLSYAEISPGLAHHNIDVTKLPRRLGILKTNISQIVDEGYCLAFNFINYKNTGKCKNLKYASINSVRRIEMKEIREIIVWNVLVDTRRFIAGVPMLSKKLFKMWTDQSQVYTPYHASRRRLA